MAFGDTSSTEIRSEINITPLVDVVLVLLIIFMVATPIMQLGLDVEVPPKVEVQSTSKTAGTGQIVITVRRGGWDLNGAMIGTRDALRDAVKAQLASRGPNDRVAFVTAEDQVPFQKAVEAMDAAREAGAQHVGFLTDPVR